MHGLLLAASVIINTPAPPPVVNSAPPGTPVAPVAVVPPPLGAPIAPVAVVPPLLGAPIAPVAVASPGAFGFPVTPVAPGVQPGIVVGNTLPTLPTPQPLSISPVALIPGTTVTQSPTANTAVGFPILGLALPQQSVAPPTVVVVPSGGGTVVSSEQPRASGDGLPELAPGAAPVVIPIQSSE